MTRPPIIVGAVRRAPVVAGAVRGPQVTAGPGVVVVPGTGVQGARLNDLDDFEAADVPPDVPLALRLGDDGVFRPEPIVAPVTWGHPVRFATGPPTDPEAPDGALHVDLSTHRIYRKEQP